MTIVYHIHLAPLRLGEDLFAGIPQLAPLVYKNLPVITKPPKSAERRRAYLECGVEESSAKEGANNEAPQTPTLSFQSSDVVNTR